MRGLGVAAIFFGLYLFTLYPTVSPYRDSGDLAASAATLGIAHPPGYPLYSLAGRAWLSILRLGDPAYRLNVFSALCAALTLFLLMITLKSSPAPFQGEGAPRPLSLTGRGQGEDSPWPSLGAVLFLGLSPAFWKLSLVSEMYALNALFAAALLFLLRTPRNVRWPLIALLFGLALSNHQTILFLAPGPFLLFLREQPLKKALLPLLFLAAGLLLYLYLPLRSLQDPWLDWGQPRHLREFLRVLSRADYGGLRLHPERSLTLGWPVLRDAALVNWRAFTRQAGLALAVCALGAWTRRQEPLTLFCLTGFLLSGPFFIVLSNLPPDAADSLPILEPHLVLPLLCLAPLFAYGLSSLLPLTGGGLGWRVPSVFLLAFLPVAQALFHPLPDHRHDFSAVDYERNLVSAMEPGALILDPDDPTAFTLSYLSAARAVRDDLVPLLYFRTRWGYDQLHRRHPDVVPSSSIQSGHELYFYLLRYNLSRSRPVYADLPHKVLPPYTSFPQGWAYRVHPFDQPPADPGEWYARAGRLWELSRARAPVTEDFFSVHALDYGASARNNLGVKALNDGRLDLAEAAFKASLAMQPKLDQPWNNWANVVYRRQQYGRAAAAYRIALSAKPAPQYRYNLGRALMAGGDQAAAEREWTAAAAEADIPDAENDLALLWLARGEAERAERSFGSILSRHPEYAPALFNLGLARARLGRKAEAAAAFRAFRDAAPDPADKSDADAWLKKLGAR